MKEYIERAAVEKMLEDAQLISDGEYCGYCTEDVSLNRIPAADVAEVRHGYWDDSLDGLTPYFSVCRCTHRCLIRRPIYCPNCGARMDKEDEQ